MKIEQPKMLRASSLFLISFIGDITAKSRRWLIALASTIKPAIVHGRVQISSSQRFIGMDFAKIGPWGSNSFKI
ncbi:MAG TPA: hypothetical protein VGO57_19045 [Verrucomicrobiae bacterium]